jgi:hypothetical protein
MQIAYIIGAGASAEIGMPVGNELKNQIMAFLSNEPDKLRKYNLEQAAEFGKEAIAIFSERVKPGFLEKHHLNIMSDMRHAIAHDFSIDNFLFTHQNNYAYQIIGKIAIFVTILQAEKSSMLWTETKNYTYTDILEKTWYLSLFQQLIRQATLKDFVRRLKETQFITFNYDRSLEFYLYQSIQRYYEVSETEAAEIMSNANIYHPYGQVGFLPYQKRSLSFDYGYFQKYGKNDLSQYIKTYTEGTDTESHEYKTAVYNLYEAVKVVFLGFAFHRQNIDLLYKLFKSWNDERKSEQLGTPNGYWYYATFYQVSQDNIQKTENILNCFCDKIRKFNVCNDKCVGLFNEFSKSLEMH